MKFLKKIAKKYYTDIIKELTSSTARTANDNKRGSAAFEAKLYSGWVIGHPEYAHSEPHHQRHGDGGWTYEEMYPLRREAELLTLFEGPPGIILDDETIILSQSPNGDWGYLLRSGDRDFAIDDYFIDGGGIDVWDSPEDEIKIFNMSISNDPDSGYETASPESPETIMRWADEWFS